MGSYLLMESYFLFFFKFLNFVFIDLLLLFYLFIIIIIIFFFKKADVTSTAEGIPPKAPRSSSALVHAHSNMGGNHYGLCGSFASFRWLGYNFGCG